MPAKRFTVCALVRVVAVAVAAVVVVSAMLGWPQREKSIQPRRERKRERAKLTSLHCIFLSAPLFVVQIQMATLFSNEN